jgi:hypothetical protein
MPSIKHHQSSTVTKLLLMGDPGAGKSGSVVSLAAAGYNLRILDMDNGLDVVKSFASDPKSDYVKTNAEIANNIRYKTITDVMKNVNGRLIPGKAEAWSKAIKSIEHWKEDASDDEPAIDLGNITTWGPNDILVIDSLTFLCKAALNFILAMNGRLGQQAHQSDWYHAQTLVEGLLEQIKSEQVKCNVIMMAHVTTVGGEGQPEKGYPMSLGKALSPKIGSYFNNALMIQTTGQGSNQKRRIKTNTTGIVELKNSAPLSVLPEYDISNGLAEYFKAVRGANPK